MKSIIYRSLYDNLVTNYINFSGTMKRGEYWQFILLLHAIHGIVYLALVAASMVSALYVASYALLFTLMIVSSTALMLPVLSATVRRLQDSQNSGWLLMLNLIPILGQIVMVILLLLSSKPPYIPMTSNGTTDQPMTAEPINAASADASGALHVDSTTETGVTAEQPVTAIPESNTPKKYSIPLIIVSLCISCISYPVANSMVVDAFTKEVEALEFIEPGAFTTAAAKIAGGEEELIAARDVVENYYALLYEERYDEAYRLLSSRERERYGTKEQWLNMVKSLPRGEADLATLSYAFKEELEPNDRYLEFSVYVDGDGCRCMDDVVLTYENNSWRIFAIK